MVFTASWFRFWQSGPSHRIPLRGLGAAATLTMNPAACFCMDDRSSSGNWRHRWPGKYRADRGTSRKQPVNLVPPGMGVSSREATKSGLSVSRPAQPALTFQPLELKAQSSRDVKVPMLNDPEGLARRFALGRDVKNFVDVMTARLIGQRRSVTGSPMQPARGLSASLDDADVFILRTFVRHRVARADVVPLRLGPAPNTFIAFMRDALACEQRQLRNVGVHYQIASSRVRASTKLVFRASDRREENIIESISRHLAITRCSSKLFTPSAPCSSSERVAADSWGLPDGSLEPRRILPAALHEHLEKCRAEGHKHVVAPRTDQRRVGYVLDTPAPFTFNDRGYRCQTCKKDCTGLKSMTFNVSRADVEREFPGIL